MTDNYRDNLMDLMGYSFASSLFLGLALILFAFYQDYIWYELYSVIQGILNVVGSKIDVLAMLDTTNQAFLLLPNFLDIVWLIITIVFIGDLFIVSYRTKREGYYGAISMLIFGSMIYLFISGIFLTLSNWFMDEVVYALVPNLSLVTPLFNYYLSHAGLINLLLFVGLVLVNVMDLDFSGFNRRKDKEKAEMVEAL